MMWGWIIGAWIVLSFPAAFVVAAFMRVGHDDMAELFERDWHDQ